MRLVVAYLALLFTLTSCGETTIEVLSDAPDMSVMSPAFLHNGHIPTYYTCYGKGERIPFEIKDVPPEGKSLLITMTDPDAPGKAKVHWLAWNIPPALRVFSPATVISFPEGKNGDQTIGYMPPCPVQGTGTHRYILNIYALDTLLTAKEGSAYEDILIAMRNHVRARATLTGIYP